MKNHAVWLIYTGAVASCVSLAFNIDTTNPQMYRAQQEDFFTSQVGGFKSDKNKGVPVTEISLTDNQVPIKYFGLTVTENSTHSQLTVRKSQNYCEHGSCFQDGTNRTVNIVFLFDGSGSLTEAEFHENKEFIVDIMESLKNLSIKFAAVQFSSEYRKVFDFNDYEDGTAHEKLMRERHMKDLTNTHRALNYVLNEIFDSPDAGASPDATKVLVLITDGNPSDRDRNNITKRYDEKNIIRFVIAVKNVDLNRLENISSEPNNTFKIENYNELSGVLENFQKKIFKVEGEVATLAGNLTNEMAQSGFSAVYNKLCSQGAKLNQKTDYCEHGFTFQDCTKRTANIVFLFDGSGSMTQAEFHKNKEFIVDIMECLNNSSIKFAAVQFSSEYRKVFDFNDHAAAHEKLMREPQMKYLTNTHKALNYVLDELFENPDAGASPDAIKALVLITDGEPSDKDRDNIIKRLDERNIIRFVIAVKSVSLDRFQNIASETENIFRIENYDGLRGLLGTLSNKIKGTGFSAVFYKVCSPSVLRECYENFNLNAVCHKMSSFTPALPECTKRTVNLIFLFDGSGSMTEDEFHKNKEFIQSLMESLKKTSITFAAVQFSSEYRKVFDFNDYEAGTAHEKLMREPHMKELTNTHRALRYVLDELFENPDAGACPDAIKALVLITDGEPSDRDRENIIKRLDEKNIIRFVIGVKGVSLERIQYIASEPKSTFIMENYDGLTRLLEYFLSKIKEENSGFSAVFSKDTLTLSPLGSNSWRGFLQECPKTQSANPETKTASYWGNSVSVGQRKSVPLYFTGAPRFEHIGQVVLFTHNYNNWIVSQRITGDQIGSHFGAELCSLDVNSDGDTDFLLVGAPLFHLPSERGEGQIYIYTLTDEVQLKSVLNVTAPSTGRFGTSISSIKDLNGDGLRDIAVGAPFEDDNRGAVYIYLGDRHSGIRTTFSQRIKGEMVQSGIRFFGQAIDGNMDLKDDKLPDIVVGSQGAAVILSSKPVVNVVARLSFKPAVISTEKLYCPDNTNEKLHMVTIKTCFEMNEATNSETADIGLNITYTLTVDPMRQTNRGFFNKTDKRPRNLTSTYELQEPETCFEYPIFTPKCVKDTLSPVTIKLQFSQPDSHMAGAILNVDNNNQSFIEVPFQQ